MGSSRTLAAVSRRVFAFCNAIKVSSEACFSNFLFSVPLINPSILRFPNRYPSISSVVPAVPLAGPWYIQSTRSTRFLLPAASSLAWISSFARSSFNSLMRCSVRFRSSKAFFSSSHTRLWLLMSTGCHDFFKLRSPPILTASTIKQGLAEVTRGDQKDAIQYSEDQRRSRAIALQTTVLVRFRERLWVTVTRTSQVAAPKVVAGHKTS
jgi:hypothetical protein